MVKQFKNMDQTYSFSKRPGEMEETRRRGNCWMSNGIWQLQNKKIIVPLEDWQ